MDTILLSGVGGSTNWMPLVFPLIAVMIIVYAVDFTIRFFKKRRQTKNEIKHTEINSQPEWQTTSHVIPKNMVS